MIKRKLILFLLVFILLLTVLVRWVSYKSTDLSGYTVLIHTNDSHGRAEPSSKKGEMGFTAVSALKKYYESEGAEVILLDAGDTLHGTALAEKSEGKRIVSIMNLVGYDAMVPGNNDFNYGTKVLRKRAGRMDFPLLSANITYKKSGKAFLRDSIILERNGVKYGIFGLTTTDTVTKEDPEDIDKINFINPVTAAATEVDKLKKEGADKIIALTHLGIDDGSEYTSKTVAEMVKGIDLIVDGHSHTVLKNGLKVNDTLIVSAGEYIKHIGVVTIAPDGSREAVLLNPEDFKGTDPEVDKLIKSYSK